METAIPQVIKKKKKSWYFPGVPVVKNLLSSVGYVGSIPDWGTETHILQSNWAHAPEQEKFPHLIKDPVQPKRKKTIIKNAMLLKIE